MNKKLTFILIVGILIILGITFILYAIPEIKNYDKINQVSKSNNIVPNQNSISESPENEGNRISENGGSSSYISLETLGLHNKANDCWVAYEGKVYDITLFLPKHKKDLEPYCGTADKFENAFTGQHGASKVSILESTEYVGLIEN